MNILVAAGIIVGACAIAGGLLYGLHRVSRRDVLLADTTRGAGVYGVVGTSFAVLMAFVVLVAFNSYSEARLGAEDEADVILEQFRGAEFFPAAERRELQSELVCYGRAVVSHDWPAMREGGRSGVVSEWAREVQATYVGLPVETEKEGWAFGNLLTLGNDRADARRERLARADPLVTDPVWFILGLGALLNIAFVLIFIDRRSESLAIQMLLIAGVTAIVVAGLLLVWFLDHPYEDHTGGIDPVEMERTVASMHKEAPDLRLPCTKEGDPLG